MTTLVIHFSTLPKKNFHFSRHRVLFAPWLFHSNLWGRCYGKRKKSYDLWDVEKRPPYIIKIPWNLIGPVKQATTMTLSLTLGRHLKHGLGYPALQVKVGHSTTHLRLLGWSISLDPSLMTISLMQTCGSLMCPLLLLCARRYYTEFSLIAICLQHKAFTMHVFDSKKAKTIILIWLLHI